MKFSELRKLLNLSRNETEDARRELLHTKALQISAVVRGPGEGNLLCSRKRLHPLLLLQQRGDEARRAAHYETAREFTRALVDLGCFEVEERTDSETQELVITYSLGVFKASSSHR